MIETNTLRAVKQELLVILFGKMVLYYTTTDTLFIFPPPVVRVGEHRQSGEGASLRLPLGIHHHLQWWPFEVGRPAPQDDLGYECSGSQGK